MQIRAGSVFLQIVMVDLQINCARGRSCVVCEFNLERSSFEVEKRYDKLNGQFRQTCKLNLNTKKVWLWGTPRSTLSVSTCDGWYV